MARDAKFDWINAVLADSRFTGKEQVVLTKCALTYVRNGQDMFAVRQTIIAERCSTSVVTVKRAIAKARQFGYLVLAEERVRGRGHHSADRHCLVVPRDEIGVEPEPRIGIASEPNRDRMRPEIGIETTPQNHGLPAETPHVRVSKGCIEGSGARRDASPPPCPRHPNGYRHNEPCPTCRDLRNYDRNRPTPTPPQHVPQGPPPELTAKGYQAMRQIHDELRKRATR